VSVKKKTKGVEVLTRKTRLQPGRGGELLRRFTGRKLRALTKGVQINDRGGKRQKKFAKGWMRKLRKGKIRKCVLRRQQKSRSLRKKAAKRARELSRDTTSSLQATQINKRCYVRGERWVTAQKYRRVDARAREKP